MGLVSLKTRNKGGNILNYQGTKYFSLVSAIREKPAIFAGAIERKPDTTRIPAIRFRNENAVLRKVPEDLRFPYSKPNWTCVLIAQNTADILPQLMRAEVSSYLSEPPLVTSTDDNQAVTSDSSLPGIIVALIGIAIGLYGFFNLANDGLPFLALGFIIFLIGGALLPKQPSGQMSFSEARDELMGTRRTPSTKTRVNNLSGQSNVHPTEEAAVRCPRCNSTQITAQKRGFKVGRAVGAGIAIGPIGGLIGGAAGKNKIVITCLKCGHHWTP
jgi:hypothetical protein